MAIATISFILTNEVIKEVAQRISNTHSYSNRQLIEAYTQSSSKVEQDVISEMMNNNSSWVF